MATHIAVATTAKGVVDVIQVPTDKPGFGEVLLRVSHGSLIAFDTYVSDEGIHGETYPYVLGINAVGTVVEVGDGVEDLAIGDRVTAFAYQSSRNKALQQYNIQPRTVCAKIPDSLPSAEATTIPDNFVTSYYTLFDCLSLPIPISLPATSPPPLASTPILVYGGGSTTGQYAIQLLKLAGYTNILVTASAKHHAFLRNLGATHTFDYSSPSLTDEILRISGPGGVPLVVDCITAEGTISLIAKVVSKNGAVALLLPIKQGNRVRDAVGTRMYWELPAEMNPFEKTVRIEYVRTFHYQKNEFLKENLMPKILPSLLAQGAIQPNRVRLLDQAQGTLKQRVELGLDLLRNNKISGEKVVVKLDE